MGTLQQRYVHLDGFSCCDTIQKMTKHARSGRRRFYGEGAVASTRNRASGRLLRTGFMEAGCEQPGGCSILQRGKAFKVLIREGLGAVHIAAGNAILHNSPSGLGGSIWLGPAS